MVGFKFKTVDLNGVIDMTETTNVSETTGYSFTYTDTPYANSKPLSTGYRIGGTDISNKVRAIHKDIDTTGNVPVPAGAKSMRFIGIGGGGGGGGGGGSSVSDYGGQAWAQGGHGGNGR